MLEYFEGVRQIDSWRTPCSVPPGEQGDFRIIIQKQDPSVQRLKETWGGWILYEALDTFYYTVLQDRSPTGEWETWMTDQPQWWFAMEQIARESRGGHYLIGGLGLGIILHHLAALPEGKVESVTVVEQSKDVIDLVWPTTPKDFPFHIVNHDFWEWATHKDLPDYDVVITDMWRGDRESEAVKRAVAKTHFAINQRWPETQQFYHGMDRYACDLGLRRIKSRRAPADGSLERKYAAQTLSGANK